MANLGGEFVSEFSEHEVHIVALLEGIHELGVTQHVGRVEGTGSPGQGPGLQVETCDRVARTRVRASPRKSDIWDTDRIRSRVVDRIKRLLNLNMLFTEIYSLTAR